VKRCVALFSLSLLITPGFTSDSPAALINFTGGTVYQFGGTTFATDTTFSVDNVDYYEEDGVSFDFIGPPGNPFSYHVGNYYGVGNDVIHGHWAAGLDGDMVSISVKKTDGSAFDLNYFKITTNTGTRGDPSIGNEEVHINALSDGITVSYSMLLPPDDWGFVGPNSEIYLGTQFDGIKEFTFTYGANANGFGLDEFYIDEEPPPSVPEPTTLALLGIGLAGLAGSAIRKEWKKRVIEKSKTILQHYKTEACIEL